VLIWGGGPDNSLVFYGNGAAWDPVRDAWRDLPPWNSRFAPASVWSGRPESCSRGADFCPRQDRVPRRRRSPPPV